VARLGSSIGGYVPHVLYRFYADDLVKPHSSIRVVRLGCGEHTNPILSCFVNPEGLNWGDLLVGVVHEFIELANGM
jgi:hypothetical protein